VGVATGAEKSRAVAAAIRGGFVNTLIVDSLLAQALLANHAPRPRRTRGGIEQANTAAQVAGGEPVDTS